MAVKNDGGIVPVNTRSPEQWAVLRDVVNWKGLRVVDLGCGHGDLLLFAKEAGSRVLGVDSNVAARARGLSVVVGDLEAYLPTVKDGAFDVALCFSVLPYLKDADAALRHMARIASVSFIECQYKGDGPGMVSGDKAMRLWLKRYWPKVSKVGFSVVTIRNTKRSIWMCQKGKSV